LFLAICLSVGKVPSAEAVEFGHLLKLGESGDHACEPSRDRLDQAQDVALEYGGVLCGLEPESFASFVVAPLQVENAPVQRLDLLL